MSGKAFLARLHLDRRGAIAPVMILGFIFFGFMAAMILNTGQVVGDKIRTQNGADVAATIQGDWTARHLNTMSMNNVALTQSFTAMVVSGTNAYVVEEFGRRAWQTRTDILNRGDEICTAAAIATLGFFDYDACMTPWRLYAVPATAAAAWAGLYLGKYQPWNGFLVGQSGISAFNAMNDQLVSSLPGRVGRVATSTLAQNDLDSVFFYPPCSGDGCNSDHSIQGSSLPVSARGAGFHELCDAASNGSDGNQRLNFDKLGYPRDKGPYTGGGSSSNPHVRDYISKETTVLWISLGRALQIFRFVYPIHLWIAGTENSPLYDDSQSEDENEFTRKLTSVWDHGLCSFGGSIGISSVGGALGGMMSSVLPQPYLLKGFAGSASSFSGYGGSQLASLSVACDPRLHDFHFLAYAARSTHYRISASIYKSAITPDYSSGEDFAYGQSCVYNDKSLDLYTQNWQSKMMPAKHMDDPNSVFNALNASAPQKEFRALIDILQRSGNIDAFQVLNVH